MIFEKYHGPFKVGTLQLKPLKPKQLLIKVYACSLNAMDVKRHHGQTKFITLEKLPTGSCYDVSGIVEQVGSEVTQFAVGDRVCAMADMPDAGTMAEFCIVNEPYSAKIPSNVSFVDAAGLPMAAMTAYQALALGKLAEGQSVFIAGGAGGVGTFTIQLAKRVFKAGRVVVTCSSAKAEFCKSLGADEIIDYTKGDPYKEGRSKGPFDVVLDNVGDAAKMGGALIKPGHVVVSVVAFPETGAFDRIGMPIPFWLRGIISLGSIRYKWAASPGIYKFLFMNMNSAELSKLLGYLSDGTLKTIVDTKYQGLEKGADAFAQLATGRAKGKIILEVRNS